MSDLFVGIIASIIATILIAIFTRLYLGHKGFIGIKKTCILLKDTFSSGIINIFSSRSSYVHHKDHGTASNYIHKCNYELLYIGFWLAGGLEIGSLDNELKNLIYKKINVSVIFVDPNDDILIENISKMLSISNKELVDRIEQSIQRLKDIKDNLSNEYKKYINIYVHNVPLSASAFLIDYNHYEKCRILLDYKLYGLSREESYGIEYKNTNKIITKKVYKSYMLIRDESNFVY